ncbi:MAG: efflux RND transporter periplasmic adaptor subunit [Candidatus Omnitrophica bacterium]|nr:efflux RND transporter periplasmic adaptor subunit [Candidatus Omnitrophota bacterium]
MKGIKPSEMLKSKKARIAALVAVLVIVFAFPVIRKNILQMLMPKRSLQRPVQTAVSVRQDVPITVSAFGTLTPPEDVNIKSQVSGAIKEIHFTEGEDIKKGDLLFVIDPSSYKAQLEKAEAQVVQDQADLSLKKATLERNKQLLADHLLAQQDYDKYSTDVAQSEAKLKLDVAGVDIAKINLDYCYIRSPVDGRAGKRMVDLGNIIQENTGPTLVNIKTIDTMFLDFTIPEIDLPRTRDAMKNNTLKVEFTVQGDNDNVYTGNLQFLDNAVDNTTGTILLRAKIDNTERKLWAGQFANIRLILGIDKDVIVVPFDAVQMGQDGQYVFVITPDNTAELRLVTTGDKKGADIVILKGVQAGEKVAVSGQMGLSPGVPVIDLTAAQAGDAKKSGSKP